MDNQNHATANHDEESLQAVREHWSNATGRKVTEKEPFLSEEQARAILHSVGVVGPVSVTTVHEYNHVYRIDCGKESFFLKTFTKNWYSGPDFETYCVEHEWSAWRVLAKHGLATPEVVLVALDRENPLKQPFILTRKLAGQPLNLLLKHSSEQDISALLYMLGAYLRGMHAITFAYPGYIMGDGPTEPPAEDQWQHGIWVPTQYQKDALKWLKLVSPTLSAPVLQRLEQVFATMAEQLAPAYVPPRFVYGDCHLEQIFVVQEGEDWSISGIVDMEVASSGDSGFDMVAVCRELAQSLPSTLKWWNSLFNGYGGPPDFDLFRLRLLGGWYPYEATVWPGVGDKGFTHILATTDWEELFSRSHLDS